MNRRRSGRFATYGTTGHRYVELVRQHARECLAEFRARYNVRRPHWALVPESGGDPLTPEEVYAQGMTIGIPRWQTWARAAQNRLEQLLEEAA